MSPFVLKLEVAECPTGAVAALVPAWPEDFGVRAPFLILSILQDRMRDTTNLFDGCE